jgi:hypothetical protein
MVYQVIVTSLESNLFKEWDNLAAIPWMRATLWDFYANVLAIFCWVAYKERSFAMKGLWLVLLVTLGSIATSGYILIELFRLSPGETVKDLLVKQNG